MYLNWLQVLVIFCGPNAVKVNVIRSILTQIMNKESLSRLILVIQNQMTNPALKAVELFSFKVEIFQVKYVFLVGVYGEQFKYVNKTGYLITY